MRILGYLHRPPINITVFKHEERILLKLEQSLYEQTYKFRISEELHELSHLERLLDEPFLAQIQERFEQMRKDTAAALARFMPKEEEEELPNIL
jgi:hypothetical protein